MLNVSALQKQIKSALSQYIPAALETCMKNGASIRSEETDKAAAAFAKQFDEMVSEPLAQSIASAIDYYVKNADITGTIITVGNKFTQMAHISPPPTPITGGKIPNTFGIN